MGSDLLTQLTMKNLIRNTFIAMIAGCAGTLSMVAATTPRQSNILDIKHSITDNNIVEPESFEIKTRELEENFYLKKYSQRADNTGEPRFGTPEEYQKLLSQLPTEIEMPYNQIVGSYIEKYLGPRREMVADMLALHNYYGDIFVEELLKEGLPLELQYLPVIESALNPNAVSRAGAAGLWQFMPATAAGLGLEVNSLVDQRRDPRVASRNAVRYLKQLYEIHGDWTLAIAAYNCGTGNVNKALRRAGGGKKDYWEIYNYLLPETRGYVPAFIAANFVMNYYDKYGIRPTVAKRPLVTDTVQVGKRVNFKQIAEILDIPVEEIRMLNPQFRKDVIPGDNHPYTLVLPSQQCLSYIMSERAIIARDADQYARRTYVEPGEARETPTMLASAPTSAPDVNPQSSNASVDIEVPDQSASRKLVKITHVVGRGENLRDIAKKYGVSATDIKRWNGLARGKVKEGDHLTIETYQRVSPEQMAQQAIADVDTAAVDTPKDAVAEAVTTTDKATSDKAVAKKTVPEKEKTAKTVSGAGNAKAAAPAAAKSKAAASTAKNQTKSAGSTVYVVRKGDTLYKIANAHGTTVKAIQQANGMGSSTRLDINQKLTIPAPASKRSR